MIDGTNANKTIGEFDAAKYIGMSVHFLRHSRCHGKLKSHTPGPPFIRIGRAIRYRIEDLDTWLTAHRVNR